MNAQQIAAVRRSFAKVAPQSDAVASLFYGRLFELDPSLRRLFKPDMAAQRNSLMKMLAAGVAGLDQSDTLLPVLHELGARHVGYGIQHGHYDTVATALLDTLATGLGEEFTPDLRADWVAAYALLAGAMKAGAERLLLA
jgi:hemoglobin-like flavoprotein